MAGRTLHIVLYDGQWQNNMQHGEGNQSWADGNQRGPRTYSGQWQNHRQHGEGNKSWADGRTYSGQLKEDKQHGQGKETRANGSTHHDGQWNNGSPVK